MNQVTPESKNAAIKTLAILGFIVMIVLCVWLAVQVVRLIPAAFTTLANLVETIGENGQTEITLEEETLVANAGETISINWEGVGASGIYTFSYTCIDGISVAILRADDSKEFIACEETVELEKGEPIRLVIASEKQRFATLSYTIAFAPQNGEADIKTDGKLTVTNASIPTGTVASGEKKPETENKPVKPTPTRPTTPVTPKPGKPVTTIQYVTQIPVSDPRGYTDLAIRFISSTSIDADEDTKIKVEVKNLGTKTSKEFDVTIELPDGVEQEINNEKGLKPNEHAIYTIEFDATDLEGSETIRGEVSVSDDKTSANNSFRTTVRFED